jgi:hypothetical protein
MIEDLLDEAKLRLGPSGISRSTYNFRHTYATFRSSEGVDVYFLAQQMGTSVAMIEDHYGHVTPVKNADCILQGMTGWQPIPANPEPEAPDKSRTVRAGRGTARTPRDARRPSRSADRSKE